MKCPARDPQGRPCRLRKNHEKFPRFRRHDFSVPPPSDSSFFDPLTFTADTTHSTHGSDWSGGGGESGGAGASGGWDGGSDSGGCDGGGGD